MKRNNIKNKKKGFALLYAVLVSSILLSIGLAIFNITIKELRLSSLGRDSQFAFYAADTGIECVLYWDFQGSFATSTPPPGNTINCGGKVIEGMGGKGYGVPSTFTLDFSPECVKVSVTKYGSPTKKTKIESRGYNTCDPANPRRIERAIEVSYASF